jgi:hypothetical protein
MSETTQETATTSSNDSLIAAAWGDTPPATATVETTQEVEETVTTTTVEKESEEVVNADDYLKQNLGYSNWDEAKKEIEELRKLKESQSANENKFANQESERLYKAILEGKEDEVYEVLSKKKEFERVEKLDVTNPKDATELIRLNLKMKHPQLDTSEIEDMIADAYLRYPKPTKDFGIDEEEYEEKLKAWQIREDAIDRKVVRDAKIVKPEVLSLQSKIVIPDITTGGSKATEVSQISRISS